MIYKKALTVAALALVSSLALSTLPAFAADDGGLPKPTKETGTPKARADVKADRAQAAKAGELSQNESANPVDKKVVQAKKKTCAEVKAETAEAKLANGGTLKTPKE